MVTVEDAVNGGRKPTSDACPNCKSPLSAAGACITCNVEQAHHCNAGVGAIHDSDHEVCAQCGKHPPYAARICPYCGARFDRRILAQHELTPIVSEHLHCDRCKSPRIVGTRFCFTCGKEFFEAKNSRNVNRDSGPVDLRANDRLHRSRLIESGVAPSQSLFENGNLVMRPGRIAIQPSQLDAPHCPQCDSVPPYAARVCPYCSHRFGSRMLAQTSLTPVTLDGHNCSRCKSAVVARARYCFTCAFEFSEPIGADTGLEDSAEAGNQHGNLLSGPSRQIRPPSLPLETITLCFAAVTVMSVVLAVLAFVRG